MLPQWLPVPPLHFPALWPLLAAPFAGSLLGVLIRRLPAGRPVAAARSQCETCHARLGPAELLPVVSFLLQRGRCRRCGAAIAPMHLWVELAACLPPLCLLAFGLRDPAGLWAGCVLGWALLAAAWIDAASLLLPDAITLPLLLAGLGWTGFRDPSSLLDHAAAAALGWGGLVAFAGLYRRLRGRHGIGGGDAKLLGAAGAWLGLAALPHVLLLAALAGLAAAGVGWLRGRRIGPGTRLAFGPPLAAAIWLLWLAG